MLFSKRILCNVKCVVFAAALASILFDIELACAQQTVRNLHPTSVSRGQVRQKTSAKNTSSVARSAPRNSKVSAAVSSRTRNGQPKRPTSQVQHASAYAHTGAVNIGDSAIVTEDLPSPTPSASPATGALNEGSYFVDDSEVMDTLAPAACGVPCDPVGCLVDWSRADLWMGVAGFSGPTGFVTSGSDTAGQVEGSFGFHEGINLGSSLPSLLCGQLGAQIGLRAVQANLDGSAASLDTRNQLFLTGGLFRRVDYGFQGGLVVDYLHDDWFYQADLLQLRGELSFLMTPCHDLGFRFTANQQTEDVQAFLATGPSPVDVEISTLETYRFFYRYQFGECGRGLAEFHAGFTEDRDTLLGTHIIAPLQGQLGLQTTATYMIPHETASPAYASEAWNLGMAIVWTPGRSFGGGRDYYRPLFDVADNGSLIGRVAR